MSEIALAPEIPPQDLTRSVREDGTYISTDEFRLLPLIEQSAIRRLNFDRIRAVIDAGYGGVLSGGLIVDRRLNKTAIPIPENHAAHMKTPKPKPVL